MVGYPRGKKGWKVYDIKTKAIFTSCDVIFHEKTYPFAINENNKVHSTVDQGEGWMHDDEVGSLSGPANGATCRKSGSRNHWAKLARFAPTHSTQF